MKIAIYHELRMGGAYVLLSQISNTLKSLHHKVDIYDGLHKINIVNKKSRIRFLSVLYKQVFLLNQLNRKTAKYINSKGYDLVLVFPSVYTQTPHIIRHLNRYKICYIYMFTEPPREFYEKTTFDYLTIRRTISRVLRLPIKIVDQINCRVAQNIITLSTYENFIVRKIYKKRSYVIRPGIERKAKFTTKTIISPGDYLSIGLLSKIKGHLFSMEQTVAIKGFLKIIGKESHESRLIIHKSISFPHVQLLTKVKERAKDVFLKKTPIYLSNQIYEPFGLSTLEAISSGCFVLGKNCGGTAEIVQHGVNGLLYPDNITIAKKYMKESYTFSRNTITNWTAYTDKILYIYHLIRHEPVE